MKAVFIVLALCISFVLAQSSATPFYITYPLQGDSFKAGNTVDIRWLNGVDGSAKVSLLTGVNAAAMAYTGVTFNINGTDGEYDWKVPSDLPQNATFSLQIAYTDPTTNATATAYSAAFTLTGTTGVVVTQSFVSVISTSVSTAISTAPAVSTTALSSAVSISVSTSVPASASVTHITASASISNAAAATVSASTTPSPTANAGQAGFKASTIGICAIVMIASSVLVF